MRTYQLPDEPVESSLSSLAVRPLWPLLAIMVGGGWIGWPWLAFNSFAVGSPRKKAELFLIAAGIAGTVLTTALLIWSHGAGWIAPNTVSYGLIIPMVWKLWFAFRVYQLQDDTFDLYEFYGGTVRNGLFVVIGAALLRYTMISEIDGLILLMVLG